MLKKWLVTKQLKTRLISCFENAELYKKYKTGDRERHLYPKIHSSRVLRDPNRVEYVFTLLNGMDPKDVRKKEYVFKQVFGENIEIKGDYKKFVVSIYGESLPSELKYRFETFAPLLVSHRLPIICGKNQHGEYVSHDMVAYPHLLIAGETGSGKSTQLRSILTTLIKMKKPEELQLYLGDLKRSEFHLFRKIAHVKKVMTKTTELTKCLETLKKEMESRGDLLDKYECTHIDDLNKLRDEKLPYIVLAVDEVALLKKEKKIMAVIEDISAIGRALGVFLILSMQRPDRDVLDGKLKNNLTVRMAFKHADAINSRITIGRSGAEDIDINERGRMYLKLDKLSLIQAPYLTDMNAKKVLEGYKVAVDEKPQIVEEFTGKTIDTKPIKFGLLGGDTID
jgi:DNA segregation ATPase FtsK/SpoIIIE, S-DNA-T family